MKHSVMLTITSLLSILLVMFHLSEEVVRGMEPGGFNMLIAVLIMLVWLYGTLVFAGRRSGYIVMLLGAIFGTGVPILHMSGMGLVGGKVAADSSGAFFWVWGNLAMCTISAFSFILAVRALFNSFRKQGEVKSND
jgi:hypothetical protein